MFLCRKNFRIANMRNGLDASTLASKVYESVRRGILSGDLQPGQPMSRRRIATELQTSPLPVASAFQRLELEGLLESRPRAGTRVRALSLDEIRGHFVVREALESQAASRVALMATDGELAHLETLAHKLDDLSARRDIKEYAGAHRTFHGQIAAYSQCGALFEAVDQCHGFAMLWLSYVARPCDPNARHLELVRAMASRDPTKAGHAATEHLAFCLARAIETLSALAEQGSSSGPLFRRRRRQLSAD
jgi:DNA-binding GntR family transcriptional regulator